MIMRIQLFFAGCKENVSAELEKELEDFIDWRVLELSRCPNVGETITLQIGDYWVDMVVDSVWTRFVENGNHHFKERVWGESYGVQVKDVELMEYYGKKE